LGLLASNFYCTWNRHLRDLFETIDPVVWEQSNHNPVALLNTVSSSRIEELKSDSGFVSKLEKLSTLQNDYLSENPTCWFKQTFQGPTKGSLVAYFSAEFGVASFLKIYSGGLGVLSGDHLKSASDLCIPLVGVGLFYKKGYFSQGINSDGWQVEHYPINDPTTLPIEPVLKPDTEEPLTFSISVADRDVKVRAWKVSVGKIPLYLLDTNLPDQNSAEDCEITAELYGGDTDTRIKQEIILGFGGAKFLRLHGLVPSIYHMNEGHSSFVGLERMSALIEDKKSSRTFAEARALVRNTSVFTTHTPVPAGIDIFTRGQIEHYLSQYPKRLGISMDDLFSLGQENPESSGFNMAVLAIRSSSMINGVSNLHRHVARKLWERVLSEEDIDFEFQDHVMKGSSRAGMRMRSVTNGVHVPSWISDPMADLLDEYLGKNWMSETWKQSAWRSISQIPAESLWKARTEAKIRLAEYVSQKVPNIRSTLNKDALTIGFARRFATYKRATLLFSDHPRLEQLLLDKERPVQFVFSGKAHPRDHDGKKLIQEIISFANRDLAFGKIVFLQDYDIAVAQNMVQGVDLWLNNPRRPLEASGTSGMKVLCNGGLNMSILDGWWDEAYTPSNGWAIGTGADAANPALQDRQDAESLYDILQNHVIPEYYERTNGIPLKWIDRVKRSMSNLTPRFSSSRMVTEYAENFYFRNLTRAGKGHEDTEQPESSSRNSSIKH